jgi:hypothetical protein
LGFECPYIYFASAHVKHWQIYLKCKRRKKGRYCKIEMERKAEERTQGGSV